MRNHNSSFAQQWRDLTAQVAYYPRALGLIRDASGVWSLAWVGMLMIQGFLPPLSLYLIRTFVDRLVVAIDTKGTWEDLRPALVGATLLVGMMVMGELLRSVSDWVNIAQSELISDHIRTLIHEKLAQIDLILYESSEFHDQLEQARGQASTRPLTLLQNFGNLFRDGIAIFGMAVVLVSYGFWLPVILLLSGLPSFAIVIYFNRLHHLWWKKTTVERRWATYYDTLLTQKSSAPEIQVFDLNGHFQAAYQEIRRKLRSELLHITKQQSLSKLGAQLLTLVFFVLLMAWMVWRTLQAAGTLGDVALFFQAFNQAQSMLRSLLTTIGSIYRDSLFLNGLFEFLDLKSQMANPDQPDPAPATLQSEIQFQGVSFQYPGNQRFALHDFSLTIPAGKIVAIVGANGAGKSTLFKLLCRFYDPSSGAIALDGIDIRQMAVTELRRLFTVIFQQPVNYSATAAQNIRFGDLSAEPTMQDIESSAHSAGAHDFISRLPHTYDTLLGKLFTNGDEISGGEWQRLALARAFLRNAPIIILDEPTSALDSWSEADWFKRFRRLANGRTAIIITHRFTIAKDADTIHVMDNGQIVESGTHDELLHRGGRYAKSWQAQIQKTPENGWLRQHPNGSREPIMSQS